MAYNPPCKYPKKREGVRGAAGREVGLGLCEQADRAPAANDSDPVRAHARAGNLAALLGAGMDQDATRRADVGHRAGGGGGLRAEILASRLAWRVVDITHLGNSSFRARRERRVAPARRRTRHAHGSRRTAGSAVGGVARARLDARPAPHRVACGVHARRTAHASCDRIYGEKIHGEKTHTLTTPPADHSRGHTGRQKTSHSESAVCGHSFRRTVSTPAAAPERDHRLPIADPVRLNRQDTRVARTSG